MNISEFEPGMRVYIRTNVIGEAKLYGTVARGYSKGSIDWMVVFDGERMVMVNETNSIFFHLDERN
jgi:hypothetical protein